MCYNGHVVKFGGGHERHKMEFPYTPKNVLHAHGGKIVEITGCGHKTDRPQLGYSRDWWFFIGRVQWDDTGKLGERGHIEPGVLCGDTAEINELLGAMNAYLRKHGEWCDSKSKHEGWYAHRKERIAA